MAPLISQVQRPSTCLVSSYVTPLNGKEQSRSVTVVETLKRLLDSDRCDNYLLFKVNKGTAKYVAFVCVLLTLAAAYNVLLMTISGISLHRKLELCVGAVLLMFGWLYVHWYQLCERRDVLHPDGRALMWAGDVCIVLQALLAGMGSLLWVLSLDVCSSNTCFKNFSEKTMYPLECFIPQLFGGMMMPLLFSCHHVYSLVVAIILTFLSMIATTLLLNLEVVQIGYIALATTITAIVVFAHENFVLGEFSAYTKVASAKQVRYDDKSDENLMNVQAEEMRRMIGM